MDYIDKFVQLRKNKGLTQAQVAILLNTSTQYYQKYEKKKHQMPIDHLIKLCKFYNISADYILGLPDLPYPKGDKNEE